MNDMIQLFLTVCGAIITVSGAGAVVIAVIKAIRKPDTERDDKLKKHDELLDNDNKRLKALEERQTEMEKSQRLLLKGMEALMRHAIDGNNKEQLQKESDNLHDYIFNK
jgi:hypothetical protein